MADLYSLFRCRNCGQKFSAELNGSCGYPTNKCDVLYWHIGKNRMFRTHACSDQTQGLADLVGVSESSAV